ncbi:LamG-like jellyroll fold domain-containing protein [Flavobacterium hibisci]|uniref:LamG-like jellyroll fold domain-containing protein n=1 Tax=Flavobacterium hibisci TaxID=1914462 RepID=UPI001CBABAD6|nr:LamG-like jellyroll fold domain-containing protein [Flavobacterium hibisci]MBZ4043341.1 T9SS sorting signal type C domain-containing protein [Flavobacterium hibisci]
MKNIYITLGLFLIFVYSYGQSASNYTFTSIQGNYISLTGVAGVTDTSILATADEGISNAITLPFTFAFAGTAYTSIRVSPNGWIYLGSGTPAESNDNTQANAETRKPILFPLWDNLKCNVAPRYVTTGIAPHRRFKVEWSQQSWNNGVAGDVISFQVWLFETTNVVEFLYNQGAVAANTASSGGASIGIYDGSSRYLTLNNSSGTPVAQPDVFTTNISTKPATGQIYRFTPPVTAGLEANNYCFSASSRTYDNLLSATDVPALAASSDDVLSSTVALPFTFNFAGAFYSNIRVSSNGWITFASPNPTASQNYTNNIANANIIKPALFALWDDIELTVIPKYQVSGTAPNRIFKLEFSKQKWDYAGATDAISFQVWLYEKSNVIEYIYKQGAGALRNPSATIGIYDANGKYLLLNNVTASPTTTSSSFIFTLNAKPATGQVYRFTPPPSISYPGNAFIATGTVAVTQSGDTGGTYSATPPGLSFVSASTGEVNLTASLGGTYTISYNVGGCVTATTEMTIFPLLPQPVGTVGVASCASGSDGSITITNMNNSVRFVAADNDYIDLGSQMLSNRAAFTMGGWIKFKASDITGRMSLFGQNDAIEFGFSSSSTLELWSVATGVVTASFNPATLGNEAWHHVSVTGDGARIRIYIDGISVPVTGGVVNTTNYGASTFTTKIGSRVFSNTNGETFTGSILKAAFYSTALSASRIESLAFGPTVYSGFEPGIIAGYNFYDGSGTTLTSTPAGFNGTFQNSPEWVDPYTYAWQRVGNNTVIATTKNLTGLTPGDYRVTVALTGVSSPNAKVFTVGSAAEVVATAGTGANCTSTITANWNAVAGTTSYVLDVATDAAFTSFVTGYNGLNVGTVTTYAVTNVPPGPIFYRVRRNTSCGISANSNIIQYQTQQVKTPVATAAAILSCTSFRTNWNPVDGANAYYLDVSTDPAFGSFVTGYNGSNVGNVTSVDVTGLSSNTTYYYRVRSGNASCGMMATSSNTISILVSTGPTAPTVGTITQATCANPTAKVVLNGLPAGEWTLQFSTGQTFSGSGTSVTISDLTPGSSFTAAVKTNACYSPNSANIVLNSLVIPTSTWNGSVWSTPPTINNNIVFAANYNLAGDISGCTCTVNPGVSVVVNSGDTFTITNAVTTTGGTLTFENGASLVQTNDISNTGDIIYKRISEPMENFDYTYWSSPIDGQVLNVFSPNTLYDKYFSYNTTLLKWQHESPLNPMTPGKGYIIRTPKAGLWANGENVVFPYAQNVRFVGVPNNGSIFAEEVTSVTATRYFLIGNPYPSAVDANLFLSANSTILAGTLYFWTHNTPLSGTGYTGDDYASYNSTGGVGTSAKSDPGHNNNPALDTGKKPNGKIAAGQSFFAASKAPGTIAFTNSMRIAGNNNQFFKQGKAADSERHRVWLELSNNKEAYKQMLIGYIQGATNNYEDQFDGVTIDGHQYADFYSINNDKKLVIQGRALPFENTDLVPLGYKTAVAGNFTIGINQTEGTFTTQPIYLEDRLTQTIHNLQSSNYMFTTAAGTFDDRFVLKYSDSNLGSGDLENNKNNLIVTVNRKVINITSLNDDNISKVFLYDISGKLIYKKDKINSNQFSITQLNAAEQVLLVKVFLENDNEQTRKIIFR